MPDDTTDSATLPPFVATLNDQQPASHLQLSFLIGGDIKTFQAPVKLASMTSLKEAFDQIMAEVVKATNAATEH